jgi:hypothetical protein
LKIFSKLSFYILIVALVISYEYTDNAAPFRATRFLY